ncbi:coiled-coil domain-containing protein 91-like [Gigantopelta aegis]|uniref:coiled-coil domain-containing protein 91-like n=1 Tax=Gigantopelta aegis TaxID=1735272 RepID=UPI001B8885DA|nr:coiled-coil domain-containing protein 91-like [Gigantopelta aegis]
MDNNLSQNNSNQVAANAAGEEDDSDFGDFGGFEGAEPGPPSVNQQEQASAQWAVYTAGQGSLRPDLLCAQNAFPPCLDPSDIAGGATGGDQEPTPFEANFALGENLRENGFLDHPGGIAENASNGACNMPLRLASPRSPGLNAGGQVPVSSAPLPDLGIGTVGLGSIAEPHWPGSDVVPNESLSVQSGPPALASAAEEGRRQIVNDAGVGESQPGEAEVEQEGQHVLEAGAEENLAVKKDLENLESENARLREELAQTQGALEPQKSRLEELQTKHTRDLDEIRKAGHDALTVVVEEYKELSRTAVLEQQQASLLHLQERLQNQYDVFQQTLQSQAEELKKLHQDAMAQSEKNMQEALDRARVEQQDRFDAFLEEEKEKQNTALQLAVEAERERSKELLEAAILNEQSKATKMLEEEKEKASESLKSMKEDCVKEMEQAVEEERTKSKELLEESLKDAKEQTREAVKETQEAAQREMKSYVQEQRQADSVLRQRHLSTLDLFLDSARRQISLLLETEASASASADTPSSVNKSDDAESHHQSDSDKPAS